MSIVATFVDADSFTVATDLTLNYHAGRRVKCNCGVDGFRYGTIDSSSYGAPNTTVNLSSGSDALTVNLIGLELLVKELIKEDWRHYETKTIS